MIRRYIRFMEGLCQAGDDYAVSCRICSAYPGSRRGYPDKSAKVVKDFAGAKIVLAHLGNCIDNMETLDHLCGLDCYLDLSICYKTMADDKIKEVIKAHTADRILYGTDFPWGNIADTVKMIENSG